MIGLGRFGRTLALKLAEDGADVIAIDTRPETVAEVADNFAQAVCLDASDEKALRAQGVDEVDVAVVAIGEDFEATVLATMTLKALGVKRIITRAVEATQARVLELLGSEVIQPERDMALRLAQKLGRPGLVENIAVAPGLSLIELVAPPTWVGLLFRDLDARHRFNVNVVAIRRAVAAADLESRKLRTNEMPIVDLKELERELGREKKGGDRRELMVVPRPDDKVLQGDVLLLLGADEDLARVTA